VAQLSFHITCCDVGLLEVDGDLLKFSLKHLTKSYLDRASFSTTDGPDFAVMVDMACGVPGTSTNINHSHIRHLVECFRCMAQPDLACTG
jgi:hypothetical protein